MGKPSSRSLQNCKISDFKCTECGASTPLPRVKGVMREANHIKHIYCYKCKKETAHEEFRDTNLR